MSKNANRPHRPSERKKYCAAITQEGSRVRLTTWPWKKRGADGQQKPVSGVLVDGVRVA